MVRPYVGNASSSSSTGACTQTEIDEFVLVASRERHKLGKFIQQRKRRLEGTTVTKEGGSKKKRKKTKPSTKQMPAASASGVDSVGTGIRKKVSFRDAAD